MTIKKVCFQFAQSSEENTMKCQPAEWCNESADVDSSQEQNPIHRILGEDDCCAMSPRKSPTSIVPKRASPPTLRQNSRRRVSFFAPATPPPSLDAIQHQRSIPRSSQMTMGLRTERRCTVVKSAIFECDNRRMESNCTPPRDRPLTIPVRRYSNEDLLLS